MTDKLHDAFDQISHTGPSYAHPKQEEIIRDAAALLMTIPEGKRLHAQVKQLDITIRAIIGKEPGFFVPDANTVILVVPKAVPSIDPYEIACNLGLGIREIEISFVNIQRLTIEPHLIYQKTIDIIIEMCKIVSEFQDVHNVSKLIDLLEKLGHGSVYRLYRSQADYKEMADLIVKNLSERV